MFIQFLVLCGEIFFFYKSPCFLSLCSLCPLWFINLAFHFLNFFLIFFSMFLCELCGFIFNSLLILCGFLYVSLCSLWFSFFKFLCFPLCFSVSSVFSVVNFLRYFLILSACFNYEGLQVYECLIEIFL